ncbi:hypothetical protein ACFQ3K_04620 [Brucella gallinifaecis]|uniref:hypothetical protein n=1 Tax=Brucella gallinifaecis TaxID=215590 RepID=UPI0014564F15|nr:hypothetical protein [Brucella gallinifaecis]
MLLWRVTIVCLMIAGLTIIASLFVERKYDVYHNQPVISMITPMDIKQADGGERP